MILQSSQVDLARLIVALWVISGDDKHIPHLPASISDGISKLENQGLFPSWAGDILNPDREKKISNIFQLSRDDCLTRESNSSGLNHEEVTVSQEVARCILHDFNLDQSQAHEMGRILRNSVRP